MNQKILCLKGLPGSGKSFYAKQYCKDHPEFIRINKDDIRELLGNPPHNSKFENSVINIERNMGLAILDSGRSLLVDNTHFSEKYIKFWKNIAGSRHIEFEEYFLDTPLEQCIIQDLQREKSVGKEVILGMYKKYLEK